MRPFSVTAFGALFCLAYAESSYPQAMPGSPRSPASPMSPPEIIETNPNLRRAEGTLITADPRAGTLTVVDKGTSLNLNITSDEVKEELKAVKVGDTVKVIYAIENGKLFAKSIRIQQKPKGPPAKNEN